jgi:hypothetical protein
MKTFINLIALTALTVAGVRAGGIVISFDDPDQTATAGETLQFFGTITNTSTDTDPTDAMYLNNDSFDLALSGASYTLTDDFANTPVSLTGGESSGDIELFDITLADPVSDPLGLYGGTYGLLGGMDGGSGTAQDNLAQADFSVNVAAPTALPEEGAWPLTIALIALALVWRGWLVLAAGASRRRTL